MVERVNIMIKDKAIINTIEMRKISASILDVHMSNGLSVWISDFNDPNAHVVVGICGKAFTIKIKDGEPVCECLERKIMREAL